MKTNVIIFLACLLIGFWVGHKIKDHIRKQAPIPVSVETTAPSPDTICEALDTIGVVCDTTIYLPDVGAYEHGTEKWKPGYVDAPNKNRRPVQELSLLSDGTHCLMTTVWYDGEILDLFLLFETDNERMIGYVSSFDNRFVRTITPKEKKKDYELGLEVIKAHEEGRKPNKPKAVNKPAKKVNKPVNVEELYYKIGYSDALIDIDNYIDNNLRPTVPSDCFGELEVFYWDKLYMVNDEIDSLIIELNK